MGHVWGKTTQKISSVVEWELFTQVGLSNFKSFHEDTNIDLRQISVFIGPNGSGKSSVLQALLLWRQSIGNSALQLKSELLDLGLQDDVVGPVNEADTRLGFTVAKSLPLPGLLGNDDLVEIRTSAIASVAPNRFLSFEITAGSLHLILRQEDGQYSVRPEPYQVGETTFVFRPAGNIVQAIDLRSVDPPSPAGTRDIQQVLNIANPSLSGVRFVPALRGFEVARYPLGQHTSQDFATNTNPNVNANILATTLSYNDQLRENLSEVLHSLTGVTLDRELAPERLATPVSLRSVATTRPKRVVPTNEGFGTNQLIHLLSQTLVTAAGETVLIEEPESHLHPSTQGTLGTWIAQHAVANSKQLLITTHSEHFLGGLLWQVREEVIEPADLAVYYFKLDDNGNTVVQRLDVTHGGLIQAASVNSLQTQQRFRVGLSFSGGCGAKTTFFMLEPPGYGSR